MKSSGEETPTKANSNSDNNQMTEVEKLQNILALASWKPEDTVFGVVLKGPNNEVLLPPGLFEDIETKVARLETSKFMTMN